MRTKTIFVCLSLGMAGMLASCSSDTAELSTCGKKGTLTLDLNSGVKFEAGTRAVDESSYQNYDNYTVNVADSRGNSKFSGTYAQLRDRMPMELDLGSYTITASYGAEHAASREEFMVTGQSTFSIEAGKDITANVTCVPTCGKLSVQFDASMATYYSQYYVNFSGSAAMGTGNAAWNSEDTAPYYVTLDPSGETLTYTIHLTAKEDYATQLADGTKKTDGEVTGTFTLERNKAYKLKISPNYTPSTEGGLSIQITIDETTNDKQIDIEVPISWI